MFNKKKPNPSGNVSAALPELKELTDEELKELAGGQLLNINSSVDLGVGVGVGVEIEGQLSNLLT